MDIASPPAHLSLLADPPVPRVEARARVVTGGRNIITSWCTQTSHRMWHRRPPSLVRSAVLHPGALADAVAQLRAERGRSVDERRVAGVVQVQRHVQALRIEPGDEQAIAVP